MSSCFVPGGRFGRTMCAYVKKVDSFYLLVTRILSTGRRRVRDGYCCDLKKVDSFYLLVTWILSTGRVCLYDASELMCAYVKNVDSVYLLITWILSTGRRRVRDSMVRF